MVGHESAALAVKTVVDDACGVDVVEDWVRVALVAGGEDDDLEVFGETFEQLLGVWADVDEAAGDLALEGFERYFDLVSRGHDLTCVY